MEIVVAADSDERGLTLLRVLSALKGFVLTYFPQLGQCPFHCSKSDSTSGKSNCQSTVQPTTQCGTETCTKGSYNTAENVTSEMPSIGEKQVEGKIEEICQELILSEETLHDVCQSLNRELDRGLGRDTNKQATIKCFPTYVQELPNGKETGRFLALDLGGTNFRVLLIELTANKFNMESRIYAVPPEIMIGPGTGLFDHIAECMAKFIEERDLKSELLPLGFTFSFPCAQEGLTKARLVRWTKGFMCAGVEGYDVVALLKEAIARRGDVRIKICAVLNDTTGTLMSCAWKNHNCKIGLIVGTGTNACYMEKLEKVELWDGDTDGSDEVVVNTEWGAFGDNGCLANIRTQYDFNIDQDSLNPGRQLFEKMISGMYMGEIARQVLVRLMKEGLLFEGQEGGALEEKGLFFTKYISEIESDADGDYSNCRAVLEDLGYLDASDTECAAVRRVCTCISTRAAHLAGAGVAVLLNRINENNVTVAVDGSVFRFHPHFKSLMIEVISKLVEPGIEFDLMLSEDGSGRGAALVAAVACRRAAEAKR